MKPPVFFIHLFILIGMISLLSAQQLNTSNLEERIEQLIPQTVNDTTPGLVIGIVHHGELIFSKGYGLANLNYGIKNDPKMVYNLGSVSKQFLGYAFAMLQKEEKLSLDDPVGKYLENWPEFEQEVTLRHLLSHTSGYREAYTISNLSGRFIGTDRLSQEECLEVVRRQPNLEFEPGSRFTYNSTAWVILAKVLEKVIGTPADEWVETNIFQPLKMNDSQIETYVGEVIYNAAESYSYNPKQGFANKNSNRAIFGAADIYASLPDLANWITNLQTGELGGKEVLDLFLEPYRLNDGRNSNYALGIGNGNFKGLERYRHTGGHEAFTTQLSYYPEFDLGIITISNYGSRGFIPTSKIAELLMKEHMVVEEATEAVSLSTENLEPYAGFYISQNLNRTATIVFAGDKLKVKNGPILIPTSKSSFRAEGTDARLEFKQSQNGELQFILENENKEVFTKAEDWNPDLQELEEFEGKYWSEELETYYSLAIQDEKLMIQNRWLGEIFLEPVTQDLFKTNKGVYLKFMRNSEKELGGFEANSSRTLKVKFDRKHT